MNQEDLMREALAVSMELITSDVMDSKHIAGEAFPFIKRAAGKLCISDDLDYTPEEKADVIEGFQIAMRYYSQVTNTQGITSIDLT